MKITIDQIKEERKLLHCSLRDAHRSVEKKNLLTSVEEFRTAKDNVPDKFAAMLTDLVEAIYR